VSEFGKMNAVMRVPRCRFCQAPLELTVVDLGMSPLCESYVAPDGLEAMERFYPLHARVCTRCWLVQIPDVVPREDIFCEYAYFSGYATSWVEHARRYVEMIQGRLRLGRDDVVVELASNDGYLLQHFVGTGIDILGIDPASNVALAAEARGVPTLVDFFGREVAERLVSDGRQASLVIGNNVLAQVPDVNDFVAGVAVLLRPDGTATFEFPHLLQLIERVEYDTIYHEHFSYFSLTTTVEILAAQGLAVYDVDELATHGGSLRVYAQHEGGPHPVGADVARLITVEESRGLRRASTYERFAEDVNASKHALLELLIHLKRKGSAVAGYGAPGKGNTLLNFCGIRTDLVEYTVDRNPYKQGLYTPGTRIPIFPPEHLAETRPAYILVLPWNLIDEISTQLEHTSEWGAKLIVPIPTATVIEPGAGAGERLAAGQAA
jgi:hypothetical protein